MNTRPEWRLRFGDGHWTLTHTRCDTTSPPYPVHSMCDTWRLGHTCETKEAAA